MPAQGPAGAPWQLRAARPFPPAQAAAVTTHVPVTYYVSPSGSDSNTGTSSLAPWQTITKVNATTLYPGDSVLFQGGQTWTGTTLLLTWAGTAANPITIGTYGAGQATITNGANDAIFAQNVGGYIVQNINAAATTGSASYSGIEFYAAATGTLPAIQILNCTASGGWKWGILAGGLNSADGWNGITVSGCDASGNVYGGIHTYGPAFNPAAPVYNHSNVTVSNCTANNNLGSAAVTTAYTGSGILLSAVNGGTISGCVTHGNGLNNGYVFQGPVGCWCYISNNVTITGCVSYGNGTGTVSDGDGFDLDIDCTNCTIEYCLSYGNAGAGILCWGGTSDTFWGSTGANIVRYNLCWGNGQNPSAQAGYYGEITPGGTLNNLRIYGNTCIAQPNGSVEPSPLSFPVSNTLTGVQVFNNIFYAASTGPVVSVLSSWTVSQLWLAGNSYYSAGGGLAISQGGTTYTTLAAWRAATFNEVQGTRALGWDLDPRLAAPGSMPAVTSAGNLAGAAGMKISGGSPLAGRGLNLTALFGISPGSQDAFGNTLVTPLWVGAFQGVNAAAFPAGPLGLQLEVLLGSYWTDVTHYALQREGTSPPITISRGRPDETGTATPATAALQLNNRDGRFSPRNPTGPYYGLISRNTPLRASVPALVNYLRLEGDATSYVSCPASAGIEIAGDIDLRIDVQPSNYGAMTLAARYEGGAGSWAWLANADGTTTFWWFDAGSTLWSAKSTAPLPGHGRWAARVTLSAASGTVTFYTASTIGGSWTQLGAAKATAATSLKGGTSPVKIGYSSSWATVGYGGLQGRVSGFQILSGIGGTLKASPDFTASTPGASTLTDAESNVWTLNGTAEFSARDYRFHGEMASLPQRWDTSGTDVWTPVQGAGMLRRLGQGTSPVQSPIRRATLAQAGSLFPVAYWPMEDGTQATALGSATGGPAMTWGGTPTLASNSAFACSNPIPVLNGAEFDGLVDAYSGGTAAVVRFLLSVPASTSTPNNAIVARVLTNGTAREIRLQYTTAGGGGFTLSAYDNTGALLLSQNNAFSLAGQQWWVSIEATVSGGSIEYAAVLIAPGGTTAFTTTPQLILSATVGNVTGVQFNPANNITDLAIGHCQVQGTWQSLFNFQQPLNAWTGETAGARYARLCGENSYPARITGWPGASAAMGPQPVQDLGTLLKECEDADMGIAAEPRTALALGYRTLASLTAQSAALTLNYAAAHLSGELVPTDDDQYTRNDITVTQSSPGTGKSGGVVQLVLNDGSALSIGSPPAGVGDYASSVNANVQATSQLYDTAGWQLHTGTVNEERYPSVEVNLARTELAAMFAAIQGTDIGDYLQVTSPPAWLPPDMIRQLAWGYDEDLGGFFWTIKFNCVPESPYEVGLFDDLVYGHADTDGSQLATGISSSATTMSVNTTGPSGIIWTTSAADFPFDVIMGGEQITVTNITGSSSPQAFTITRSVNGVVKAHTAGEDIRLRFPAILAVT